MSPAPSPAGFANLVGPDLIVIALIMLVCGLPYVVFVGFVAARKGKSVPLFCILCFMPLVNVIAAIWLASLTDASVNSRLADLERRTPPPIYQSMKPTAPLRSNFSLLATDPARGLSLSR